MSLTRTLRGLVVVLPLLAACAAKEAPPPPPPEPMSQGGAQAIRDAWVNMFMTKNAAGMAEFYADDAVMTGPDGVVSNGKAAVMEHFSQMMAQGVDSVALGTASFEASGDQATMKGTWVMRALDPKSKELKFRQRGEYVTVFVRQADGGFKIAKDSAFNATDVKR